MLGLENDSVAILKAECKVSGLSVLSQCVALVLIYTAQDLDLSIALPATPALICCVGMRVVEYRIFVACRNSTVYAPSPAQAAALNAPRAST